MIDEVVSSVFDDAIAAFRQQSRTSAYYADPVLWAQDVLGITAWSIQEDILNAVQNHDHVAVRSCHGSGKSFIAALIACWWVSTRPEGEAIVVVTAPTYPQVHGIIFENMRNFHARAQERYEAGKSPMRMPGHITLGDQWISDSGKLMGMGRKPADGNQHAFQGIHRPYVLVIADESCGISEALFTAIEAITTTQNSRVVSIGNPDDPATPFNKFFFGREQELWTKIDICAFDSPNFTKNHQGHYKGCDNPLCLERKWAERWDRDRKKQLPNIVLEQLPNPEWVEQRRTAWGEDSPLWASKVMGRFPDQSVNTLFSRDTLNRGLNCDVKPYRHSEVVLGVDLARFGPDYSTIYKYETGRTMLFDENGIPTGKYEGKDGGKLTLLDFWGGKADEVKADGMESAARIHQWAQNVGASEVRIDTDGVGGPIADQVNRLSDGAYKVIFMKGGTPSPDPFRWVNARAFWYDRLRERMFNGEIDIDPKDTKLEEELEQIQYHFKNRKSALQIESKEDMDHRGVKSPDFSDAAVYASADLSGVVDNPIAQLAPGSKFGISAYDFLGGDEFDYAFGPY